MKFTQYFLHTRSRPDRAMIRDEWIRDVLENPEESQVQSDGAYPLVEEDSRVGQPGFEGYCLGRQGHRSQRIF